MPENIKNLVNKIENEGVLLLSFSEILQAKSYLEKNSVNSEDSDKNLYFEMINEAFVNEKNKLIEEIFELRDLLSRISVI